MVTCGYTLYLLCDCQGCRDNPSETTRNAGEFVGETYAECAKQAKKEGWRISKCKVYCSAPKHGAFIKD